MSLVVLFLAVLKASAVSIGGLASVPLLREDIVATGLASEHQLLESLTIGRLSPGPGGLYMVSLGYFAQGPMGAVLALVAACIPPLAFVFLTGYVRKQLASSAVTGLIRGVALSSTALVIATGVQLLVPQGAIGAVPAWQLALAGGAAVLTSQGRVHPGILVGVGCAVGVVLGA